MHSARIRLPSVWTDKERRHHVDTLISCLNLTDVQHNLVGDHISSAISGGQRKRVSIGVELAAAPMALFLDEPTSGLDSTGALSIMKLLKSLSQLGVTVICIIHQPRPEILDCLDGIHLLGAGHQIYHGELCQLDDYFNRLGLDISGVSNMTDAVLDIVSGHSPMYSTSQRKVTLDELAQHWHSQAPKMLGQSQGHEVELPATEEVEILLRSASSRGASWPTQAYLCFRRSLTQQWQRKTSFLLEISVGAIAGLLIGLSLYQLRGRLFQGIYLPPFEILSSAVSYTLVPQTGLLCSLAIGTQCTLTTAYCLTHANCTKPQV